MDPDRGRLIQAGDDAQGQVGRGRDDIDGGGGRRRQGLHDDVPRRPGPGDVGGPAPRVRAPQRGQGGGHDVRGRAQEGLRVGEHGADRLQVVGRLGGRIEVGAAGLGIVEDLLRQLVALDLLARGLLLAGVRDDGAQVPALRPRGRQYRLQARPELGGVRGGGVGPVECDDDIASAVGGLAGQDRQLPAQEAARVQGAQRRRVGAGAQDPRGRLGHRGLGNEDHPVVDRGDARGGVGQVLRDGQVAGPGDHRGDGLRQERQGLGVQGAARQRRRRAPRLPGGDGLIGPGEGPGREIPLAQVRQGGDVGVRPRQGDEVAAATRRPQRLDERAAGVGGGAGRGRRRRLGRGRGAGGGFGRGRGRRGGPGVIRVLRGGGVGPGPERRHERGIHGEDDAGAGQGEKPLHPRAQRLHGGRIRLIALGQQVHLGGRGDHGDHDRHPRGAHRDARVPHDDRAIPGEALPVLGHRHLHAARSPLRGAAQGQVLGRHGHGEGRRGARLDRAQAGGDHRAQLGVPLVGEPRLQAAERDLGGALDLDDEIDRLQGLVGAVDDRARDLEVLAGGEDLRRQGVDGHAHPAVGRRGVGRGQGGRRRSQGRGEERHGGEHEDEAADDGRNARQGSGAHGGTVPAQRRDQDLVSHPSPTRISRAAATIRRSLG